MDVRKFLLITGCAAATYSSGSNDVTEFNTENTPQLVTPNPRAGSESGMLALVWYVMTFGALIIFFTFLSCSGGLCRRMPPAQVILPLETPLGRRKSHTPPEKPPAYELFAPPAYDTVVQEGTASSSQKKPECSVFTITTV